MSKKTPSQGFNYKFEIVFDKEERNNPTKNKEVDQQTETTS